MLSRAACNERIYWSNSLFLLCHHILWSPASLKHVSQTDFIWNFPVSLKYFYQHSLITPIYSETKILLDQPPCYFQSSGVTCFPDSLLPLGTPGPQRSYVVVYLIPVQSDRYLNPNEEFHLESQAGTVKSTDGLMHYWTTMNWYQLQWSLRGLQSLESHAFFMARPGHRALVWNSASGRHKGRESRDLVL